MKAAPQAPRANRLRNLIFEIGRGYVRAPGRRMDQRKRDIEILIKLGVAKIIRLKIGGMYGRRGHSYVALVNPPAPLRIVDTGGPWAKRRALLGDAAPAYTRVGK